VYRAWRLITLAACLLAVGLVTGFGASAAEAGVVNYCGGQHSYGWDCFARESDGSLNIHTYDDNWLTMKGPYYGCAYIESENGVTGTGDCDYSPYAYVSIGNNTANRMRVAVANGDSSNMYTINGSASY
jgi:hypothetical protein